MTAPSPAPRLIVLAGLPGTGKTTLARAAAARLGAVHLRIDTIEQAMRDAAIGVGDLADIGYRVAYGVAGDNLRLGHRVIADSVNPVPITRTAWAEVAARAAAPLRQIEVVCSDPAEHSRRVARRRSDIPTLVLPDWGAVCARDYRPWTDADLRIDTAGLTIDEAAARLIEAAL